MRMQTKAASALHGSAAFSVRKGRNSRPWRRPMPFQRKYNDRYSSSSARRWRRPVHAADRAKSVRGLASR